MTSKLLQTCTVGMFLALLTSCYPPLVPYNQGPPLPALDPAATGTGTVDDPNQKRLKDTRREVAEGGYDGGSGSGQETVNPDPNPDDNGGTRQQKPNYPYALSIPGKDGFVFNPYTNNPVDVRGIPSGTLVRDPQDPNADHKFRVP